MARTKPMRKIKTAQDYKVMWDEFERAIESTSILAENARSQYGEKELGGQLAQSTLELIDRADEIRQWVAAGNPLPGQIQEAPAAQEVPQTTLASMRILRACARIPDKFERKAEQEEIDPDELEEIIMNDPSEIYNEMRQRIEDSTLEEERLPSRNRATEMIFEILDSSEYGQKYEYYSLHGAADRLAYTILTDLGSQK